MAWAHADYESSADDATRLTELRAHIGEVGAAIRADVGAAGNTRGSGSLVAYMQILTARLKELEARGGGAVGASDPRATCGFSRGRPARW